jgi:outer membrane protein assembly factor BamB
MTQNIMFNNIVRNSYPITSLEYFTEENDWWMFHNDPFHSGFIPINISLPIELCWSSEADSDIQSSPAVSQGCVIFGSNNGRVRCFHADNGTKLWQFNTGADVKSSPAIFNNKIYVGSSDDYLYCLDIDNGSLIWSYKTESVIE